MEIEPTSQKFDWENKGNFTNFSKILTEKLVQNEDAVDLGFYHNAYTIPNQSILGHKLNFKAWTWLILKGFGWYFIR